MWKGKRSEKADFGETTYETNFILIQINGTTFVKTDKCRVQIQHPHGLNETNYHYKQKGFEFNFWVKDGKFVYCILKINKLIYSTCNTLKKKPCDMCKGCRITIIPKNCIWVEGLFCKGKGHTKLPEPVKFKICLARKSDNPIVDLNQMRLL